MRRARQGVLTGRWCRRTVVMALAAALVAGAAGPGSSVAALSAPGAPHGQWQPPAGTAATSERPPTASGPEGNPEQDALLRQMQLDLLADIAAFDEDEEVRAAARDTLRKTEAGDATAIPVFFDHGQQDAKAAARKRKADADANNRAVIEPLAGTGGPVFNAAVTRALAGNAYDRADFLAFGRDIAAEQDRRDGAYDKELKNRRRMHVQTAADRGTPEVSAAAKAALAAGDAAIEEFLKTGYLAAARRDADARERYLAELEQKRKDAVAASDLAQRTARAMRARTNLLTAHADGVKALERTANDMTTAANISRETARLLASDQAGHSYHPELYQRAKDDVAREVGRAVTDARAAQSASAGAKTQVDILLQNGMPHGAQWAKVVEGMAAAADAAKHATETATHAIDAIHADAAATDAAEKAKAHQENARQWLLNAQSHAASAAQLAQAAKDQATAAAEAAELARRARVDAEAALTSARAHAANVRQARVDAERERDVAAAKRQEAEQWRQQAAAKREEAEAKQLEAAQHRDAAKRDAEIAHQKRLDAEAQQGIASGKRSEAQAQEQIAADAAGDARAQEKIARDANTSARTEEANAFQARDEAAAIAQSADSAEKKATALQGLAQRMQQSTDVTQADKDKAWAAARQARTDADIAKGAAQTARKHADDAQAAAGRARGAAIEADAAAGRARAHADAAQSAAAQARAAAREAEVAAENARRAANEAQAAAARADVAATIAEREAAAVHADALRARASAEEATAAEARAAENARNAANLAQQAAVEAATTLDAAHRTRDEANAAGVEAATAATQAGIAARSAAASVQSAAGIAAPADQAITIVSPFTGADIDADFIVMVANRAKDVGDTQVKAAQAAATDAADQAQRAADAARAAAADVAPAYQAAAAAANSAAEAARSAAAAQQSAAEAAIHGAASRKAAADADAVDAGAQADAQAARAAANQAAADAALAGRLADQAEADAHAARQAADSATRAANEASAAATRAEKDAAAANDAAKQAQLDADAARESADRAAEHARDADEAATNAENYAKDTEARAGNVEQVSRDIQAELAQIQEQLRLENEARQRQEVEQAIADDSDIPELTPDEAAALRDERGQAGVDEYNRARAEANKPLLGFIADQGGQIILDIIGYTDAKKCFTEGDFIACVMTVINALPILKIASVLSKIPDAVSAVVRIVKGIRSFKDAVVAGRRTTSNLRDLIRQLLNCRRTVGNSFTPDTLVLLADHTRKPIKDIVAGDQVLATDPATGRTDTKPVTDIITGTGEKHLVDLRIQGQGGTDGTLTATDGHPFWAENHRKWVDARDLRSGDILRTDTGTTTVTAITTRTETLAVYNLSVADLHTYYVITAGTPVLVHNQTACKVIDKEKEIKTPQPKVDPRPGPRLNLIKDKNRIADCSNGRFPADVPVNGPLENFTYLGSPAQRATSGTTCITKIVPRFGDPATPVGWDPSVTHRGHLVSAMFSGSNSLENIVLQYHAVNWSDVKIIELAVKRALQTNKQIIYKVWVQYASPTAHLPQWIFIDAIGSSGFECSATIENIPGGALSKQRC